VKVHASRWTVEYVKSRSASGGGGTLAVTFGAPGAPPSHLSFGCGAHAIARSVRAFAITPLARGAGDSIEVAARYRDGSVVPLSLVPRYQPAYPLTYEFRTPVRLPRGTILDVRSSAPGCSVGLDVGPSTLGPSTVTVAPVGRRTHGERGGGNAAAALELRPHAVAAGAREQHLERDARARTVRDPDDGMTVHRRLQVAADDEQVPWRTEKGLEILDRPAGRRVFDLEGDELLAPGNRRRRDRP
jgi:hypothetical protein